MCWLCQVKPLVSQYLKEKKLPYHEDAYISRLSLFFHRYQELMVFAPPITELVGIQWWWDEAQKTREDGHWHDDRPNLIHFQLVHKGIKIKVNVKLGSQPAERDIIMKETGYLTQKKHAGWDLNDGIIWKRKCFQRWRTIWYSKHLFV